jgi:hypothetical protein
MTYVWAFLASILFPLLLAAYGLHLSITTIPPGQRSRPYWIVGILVLFSLLVGGGQQYEAYKSDQNSDRRIGHIDATIGQVKDLATQLLSIAKTPEEFYAAFNALTKINGLQTSIQNALPKITVATPDKHVLDVVEKKVENAIVTYMATSGYAALISPDVTKNVEEMHQRGYFPQDLTDSCTSFLDLRQKVMNNPSATQSDIDQVVQKGAEVWRTLQVWSTQGTPVVINANFPLFVDEAATQQAPDITGVTLRVYGPGVGKTSLLNLPTTKLGYYRPGMKVSLESDNSRVWRDPMWYKDPKTHAIKKAFDASTDFIGRNLKELQIK